MYQERCLQKSSAVVCRETTKRLVEHDDDTDGCCSDGHLPQRVSRLGSTYIFLPSMHDES